MDGKLEKIQEDVNEIKLDLREHMSRTAQNEVMIKTLNEQFTPIQRAYIGAKWSTAVLMGVATIISALFDIIPKH
jgi:uncharacterized membrane-anchored protein YhcB (DUF1043 family)